MAPSRRGVRLRAETPMAFVRAIVWAYEKSGRSPARALAAAGIAAADVRRADARVDAAQIESMSATAMQELDDEALGWFSRRMPWGTYGMLCRASRGAPDLRVALKRWCRHHALLTNDIVLRLEERSGMARVVVEEHVPLGRLREFCLMTSLRYVHGYACWLVDSQLPVTAVTFPFPEPPHAQAYRFLFPGPATFGGPSASFAFDARYLALPPQRDEPALDRMLERALLLTIRPYRRDRLLVERVRLYLAAPKHHPATAASVAAALGVSVRTMHRQLASEGASLQAIKDDVRRASAVELLGQTRIPIKEVARRAGFGNEKSFARAFKAWTGTSPSEARAEARTPHTARR